ncbi:MAG: DNA repair protein RadC [Marivirga sp.]|jgi:DNA repair protein RadC
MEIPSDKLKGIKQWAEADRPREKLIDKGRSVLSEAELIAILIGSGTKSLSAIDVAKNILAAVDNNLNHLATLSVKDLMKFKGIGQAKAVSIVSALELGRRRKATDGVKKPKITSSLSAYEVLKPHLWDLPHEEFWVIYLNRANQVISLKQISSGGIAGTVADVRMIFKAALECLASSLILAHNHPSGNRQPSQADIQLTKKMKEAGQLIEVAVLDHIIFAEQHYFSFADEAMM